MRSVFLLIVILILSIDPVSAQKRKVDSLWNQLESAHEIESKIKYYTLLSHEYLAISLDTTDVLINKALNLSEESNIDKYLGNIYACLGDVYVMKDSLDMAYDIYTKALGYLSKKEQVFDKAMVLVVMGNINLISDNIRLAMENYFEALLIAENNGFENIIATVSNNLGIIYHESGENAQALEYYNRSYNLSEKNNNLIGMAETMDGISSVYFNMEEYESAREYVLRASELYVKAGNTTGKVMCLLSLAKIEAGEQNYDLSIAYLDSCFLQIDHTDLTYKGPRSTIFAEVFLMLGISKFHKNEFEDAKNDLMQAYRMSSENKQLKIMVLSTDHLMRIYNDFGMKDSVAKYFNLYKNYSTRLSNEKNVRTTEVLELQYEFDKKLFEKEVEISMTEARENRKNLIYLFTTSGLLLVLIIFALLLKLEKNKKRNVEMSRKSLEKELEYRNKELTTYVMYLMSKNEFMLGISEKIKKAKLENKLNQTQILNDLISELESNSESISWDEFELRFQKVHVDYYKTLNQKFPDLTPNELRLCAFLRLNMTTKEISSITYQSLKSIDIARYRLRKKLGLDKDDNLITFLQKI